MTDREAGTITERTTTVREREGAVTAREGTAMRREEAAGVREVAAGVREDTASLREETSTLREEAVRAREAAAHARTELEALMAQVREANERLVISSVQAQSMSEDAERANHLKDEFLATVSHELRTPLNAILGWSRMLGSKQLSPERAEHAIAVVERNAVALARIIEDLLDVSRIMAGTLQIRPQPVDLAAVAGSALDAVRPVATAKGVQVALSLRPGPVPLVGDPARLRQAILNVVGNAVKFTPEGGRVDLFVEPSTSSVELRVVDTGEGISPAFLPHVFERFRQADGAPNRRQSGLGLGLAIVRQIIELHGGSIDASSEGVGRGATFTIRLPIANGETAVGDQAMAGERRAAEAATSPAQPITRLDNVRVLVVDDTEDGRALTVLVLTQAGAQVTAVAAVGDALKALATQCFDVLVSDIGMPDQDGYALIREIRQHEAEHGGFLYAVALTGYARASDRTRILAAGFQAHVTKPLDPALLTEAIAAVVR